MASMLVRRVCVELFTGNSRRRRSLHDPGTPRLSHRVFAGALQPPSLLQVATGGLTARPSDRRSRSHRADRYTPARPRSSGSSVVSNGRQPRGQPPKVVVEGAGSSFGEAQPDTPGASCVELCASTTSQSSREEAPKIGRPASEVKKPYAASPKIASRAATEFPTYQREKSRVMGNARITLAVNPTAVKAKIP